MLNDGIAGADRTMYTDVQVPREAWMPVAAPRITHAHGTLLR